ncbi:MAG TPA: dTDP-4-dehydrorhamnose 3,5-epimerase [Candidatus Baltobacteraceae bacterium]
MLETRPTKFPDVTIVAPVVFADARGLFKEVFSRGEYARIGIASAFVQDNVSLSRKGVLRGLHYDLRMGKLVQCLSGRIFDVFVDMREGSPTRYRWDSIELTGENHLQVYLPPGFAHGFYTLSDEAVVLYKQSATYDPAYERAIGWRDGRIGVTWPLDGEPILSPKDAAL